VTDTKTTVKVIIEKLTADTKSILSEKVFNLAADRGIGDIIVKDSIQQLVEENFISVPVHGVLRRI
tara:strand:- start:2849 stop:3046 length:198 start_codon:yes stop_codon:yes gene_type:complete